MLRYCWPSFSTPAIASLLWWVLLVGEVQAIEETNNHQQVILNHNQALILAQEGNILPLDKVLEMANISQSDKMLEASLKRCHLRYVYLLEILDKQDQVRDLLIDAKTGERITP